MYSTQVMSPQQESLYKKQVAQIEKTFELVHFVEDNHKYFVRGVSLKRSVSGVIEMLSDKPDFSHIAATMNKRDDLPPGTMQTLWKLNSDMACAIGNRAHYFGEVFAFYRNIKPIQPLEEAVVKFWNDLPPHIIPCKVELVMYHLELLFGGMMDILLYNSKTGNFILADYKTNKNLFNNYNDQRMKAPFDDLLDMGFSKYEIQFSLYQILFEQTGLKIERRILVHLLRDGTYKMYETRDLRDRLREWLKSYV